MKPLRCLFLAAHRSSEALLLAVLAACGGGGGGSDGPPGQATPGSSAGPATGLDARPANARCVAPPRPSGGAGLQLVRVFPNLSFSQPVGMYQAPSDGSRWFVIEQQTGRVRSFPNRDTVQPAEVSTVLDLGGRVMNGSETGLLGLAFHPGWPATPQVFVYYSVAGTSPVENRVSRFTSRDGGATLDPTSEQVVLRLVKNQGDTNHNGGNIAFGPDGYLYIGTGDGGGGGDPNNNAQNRNVLFGKMLRIDVSPASGYAIPAGTHGNPYAANPQCSNGSGNAPCPEIYAMGLRNPWRWSFDRATGDLWVADVGQDNREEVNLVRRGGNYGWRLREGSLCFNPGSDCGTTGAGGEPLVDPVAEYGHGLGQSVTGGFVYRGSQLPGLVGSYVFADYVSSRVFVLKAPLPRDAATPRTVLGPGDSVLTASQNISSFAQGRDGELYLTGYGGQLFGLQPASGPVSDPIPAQLSQTGCVAGDAREPAAGLIPYAVNAPFWSDAADKQRWLALPNGGTVTPQATGRWSLPNGSVLMKHFKLNGQLVETRLLMRHPDGVWAGYTYEWNAAQTDATRVVGGKTKVIGRQTWVYPSENDCLRCHTEVAGRVLGLETAQLNRSMVYPQTGRTAHELATLNAIGVLSPALQGPASGWPALADPHDGSTGSAAQRARAFLHANCAQCHQPNGPTPTALDLRYTTALADMGICDVAPAEGTLGLANNPRLLAPGAPERSVLLARVNRRDGLAMPPLGSTVVDAVAVDVLRQWIQGLSGCR